MSPGHYSTAHATNSAETAQRFSPGRGRIDSDCAFKDVPLGEWLKARGVVERPRKSNSHGSLKERERERRQAAGGDSSPVESKLPRSRSHGSVRKPAVSPSRKHVSPVT